MADKLIGERLLNLRKERSYSREKLAELLSVGTNPIYQYETEKSDPSSEVITRMAKLFGVSVDYLVGLTDDPSPHVSSEDLSEKELHVITSWRRGEKYEAIKAIVSDE